MSATSITSGASPTRRTLIARVGLVLVGAGNAEVGIWGTVAPHSFYTTYPGAGHHWVAALGPYNEHLVRDFAGAELGFAVLLIAAAVWFGPRLMLVSGTAFLAATVPHLAYHLTTTGSFPTADNEASLGSFGLEIAVVAYAMLIAHRGALDDPPAAL